MSRDWCLARQEVHPQKTATKKILFQQSGKLRSRHMITSQKSLNTAQSRRKLGTFLADIPPTAAPKRLFRPPFPRKPLLALSKYAWILPLLLGMMIAEADPTVTTSAATGVTDLQATLKATVNANGLGYWICEFQYGKTTSYEMTSFSPARYWVDGATDGSTPIAISGAPPSLDFSNYKISPLAPATTYHYRIYVRNPDRSLQYYGADQSFTTLSAKTNPTISAVTSGSSVDLSYNAARVKSSIFSGSSATTITVEYGLTTSYGGQVSMPGTLNLNTIQATTIDIPSLTPNKLYFFRWKAVNAQGASTGLAGSFTTPSMPTVTTTAATTGITSNKATLRGTINTNGGQTVSPFFEYGTTTSYGVVDYNSSPSFVSGSSPVEVTTNLTGLLPNTTYHYRICAIQQTGVSTNTNGGDMTFTTNPLGAAPVINGPFSASEITTRSAVVRTSSVTAGTASTTVSFQYGVTTSYGGETISPVSVAANTTQDNRAATLEGLLPNTTYHFRCKATSLIGTTYGVDSVFTTASVPLVITGLATNVGDISAKLGGTVVTGGGPCYPAIQWGKTTTYGSSIPFQGNLTASGQITVGWSAGPLEPSTTYHFRLVAYDGLATIYGQDQTFTTTAPSTPPWINITRVNYAGFNIYDHQRPEVSADTAVVLASFGAGGAPATLAIEFGITSQYGSVVFSNQTVPSGQGADYMMCFIKNLTPNTTYHFRSRVTSDLGTAYSEDYTFTTLNLPVLLTKTAALISATDAVLRGSVDPKFWHYYPEFEFGTTPAFGSTPNLSLPTQMDGYQLGLPVYGPQNISASASQLSPETTYYYRLKAKTLFSGEWQYYYGPVQSFTTLANGAPAFGYAIRTAKNTPVSISDGSVLISIADSAELALNISGSAISSARGGTVIRNATGVIYTPSVGYIGLDTFPMNLSDGLGSNHSGILTAIVGDTPSSGDTRAQLDMQPDGNVALVFQLTPGLSYQVQRSTNLLTWKILQTMTATDNGLLPYTDTDPPSGAAYYRTKSN